MSKFSVFEDEEWKQKRKELEAQVAQEKGEILVRTKDGEEYMSPELYNYNKLLSLGQKIVPVPVNEVDKKISANITQEKIKDNLGDFLRIMSFPSSSGAVAGNILFDNYNKMIKAKKKGGDNYYHTLGMCESSKIGPDVGVAAFLLGLGKEGFDMMAKTNGWFGQKQIPFSVAWDDSVKDLINNWNGFWMGMDDEDCKEQVKRYVLKKYDLKF